MLTKPIPVAPPRAQEPTLADDVVAQMGQSLPSWLTSLVFHLVLVLLLALLAVSDGTWHSDAISLDVRSGSEPTADSFGQLEAAAEMPSPLAAETPDRVAESLADLPAADAAIVPEIQLAELPASSVPGGSTSHDDASAASAGGGSGLDITPARTAVFGLADEGTRFVYVFDRSESMNSVLTYSSEGTTVFSITPLEAAKAELLRSLKDLNRGHHFGIVFYNHSPWLFTLGRTSRSILPATLENKQRASAFVSSMYGQGKTNHVKPLELALQLRPDVIFLLTDGEEKDDPTPVELARLRRLNDGQTRINVIQFCYKPQTGGALAQLAEENGGRHLFFNISQLGPRMMDGSVPPITVQGDPQAASLSVP
jgi:hypothetical protein